MTLIDRLKKSLNEFDAAMTLKADYTDEIERLNSMESDLNVIHFYGANHQRVADIRKEINRIRTWIHEEETAPLLAERNRQRKDIDKDEQ